MTTKVADLGARRRGVGRLLKFCTGESAQTNRVKNIELRWEALRERFEHPPVGEETGAEYLKLPAPVQLQLKDRGYFMPCHMDSGVRGKSNVHLRSCLTMDGDHAPVGAIERVLDALLGLGQYKFYLATTRKHRPDAPRFRLIFPLTRDVTELEYLAISRRIADSIEPLDDAASIDWFDDTGFEFTRVSFWPTVSKGEEYILRESEGEWVDPDAILATYTNPADISSWPVSARLKDRIRATGRRSGNPLEKPGIIGAFCRVYSIHQAMEQFIPGVYVPGAHDDRMTYAAGSSANGALVYDNGLFLFSRHETDPCYYQNCNAFDMVRIHLFGDLDAKAPADTPINLKPSFKAMSARAAEDSTVRLELMVTRTAERAEDFEDFDREDDRTTPLQTTPEASATAPEAMPEPVPPTAEERKKARLEELRLVSEKALSSDKGALIACLATLEAIFEHDPRLKGCVATNLFTGDLLQLRRLPGMRLKIGPEGELWSDLAELKIKSYIERNYRLYVSAAAVHEAACSVGDKKGFNPVRQHLDALPPWDGVARIESFFVRQFGCEPSEYIHAVGRKIFTAAVKRVYEPGCKFDSMLVIEGPEGIGKSTLGKALSYGWFTDEMSFGFDSKEIVERSRGSWFVEVPEMVTRSNADAEHVKQFVTRQVERVRLSYARNAGDYPRQFVLIGTTNETSDYLRTVSGNRRFWCIKGDGRTFDFKAIEAERDQLWAEALVYMALDEPLYLEGAALEEARAVQAERVVKDDVAGVVEAWLEKPIRAGHWDRDPASRGDFDDDTPVVERDRVCAAEVWVECLRGTIDRFSRREALRINAVLKGLPGWEEKASIRFGNRYGQTRGFMRKLVV